MRITNKDFVELLKEAQRGPVQKLSVAGKVKLDGLVFERPITLENIHFEDGLSMHSSYFKGGLEIYKSTFGGHLASNALRVEGELTLKELAFVSGPRTAKPVCQLTRMVISGDLDVDQISGCHGISFDGSDIHGCVFLSSFTIENPTESSPFVDPNVKLALDLRRLTVGADLHLGNRLGGNFRNAFKSPKDKHLYLCGDLDLTGSTVSGMIFFGGVYLISREALHWYFAKREIEIKSKISTSSDSSEDKDKEETKDLPEVDWKSHPPSLFVTNCSAYSILSYRQQHPKHESLSEPGLVVQGEVQAHNLRIQKIFRWTALYNLTTFPFDIRGGINLEGADIAGQFDFDSLRIIGAMVANGSKFGSFLLRGRNSDPMEIGAIDFIDSDFYSYVRISSCKIGMSENDLEALPEKVQVFSRGLNIKHCKFQNGLRFWRETGEKGNLKDGRDAAMFTSWTSECNHTEIGSQCLIVDSYIDGDLDLTRLRLTPYKEFDNKDKENPKPTSAHGGIELDGTTITGSLFFKSPHSCSVDGRSSRTSRRMAEDWLAENKTKPDSFDDVQAVARFVQMCRIHVNGDVELSGLKLIAPEGSPSLNQRPGHFLAERAVVEGEMNCVVTKDEKQIAHLTVPGALRLDDSRLGELKISHHSFPFQPQGKGVHKIGNAEICGIILEEAQIGHLKVPRGSTDKKSKGGFPMPLSLKGLKVEQWSFSENTQHEERKLGDSYVAFLRNDENLNRDIYQSIFKQLKNNGNERAARRVFLSEHDRARETRTRNRKWFSFVVWSQLWKGMFDASSPWNGRFLLGLGTLLISPFLVAGLLLEAFIARPVGLIGHRFYKYLLDYGLNPGRLGFVIATCFLISLVFVSTDRRNFELTSESIQALAWVEEGSDDSIKPITRGINYDNQGSFPSPEEEDWTFWAATWMTVRYHVPLISLAARNDFEATDNGSVRFCLTGILCKIWKARTFITIKGITSEDWFSFMSVLNWILWPIFLAFAFRKSFREL